MFPELFTKISFIFLILTHGLNNFHQKYVYKHWLRNIYIGKFENVFYQQCVETSFFSQSELQNTDLGFVKKALNNTVSSVI